MAKRINPTAPYFVQMREFERRLITGAMEQADSLTDQPTMPQRLEIAATLLGVHVTYLRVRGRVLGGVFPGEPKCEPPTSTASQIWVEENGAGKTLNPIAKPRRAKKVPADA